MQMAALSWPLTMEKFFFGGTMTGAVGVFSLACARVKNNNVIVLFFPSKNSLFLLFFLIGKFFMKNPFFVLKKPF